MFPVILSGGFGDGHFAVFAVEMQGKASAVVEQIKRFCSFVAVMFRTSACSISDAVFCPHKLDTLPVADFISRFYLRTVVSCQGAVQTFGYPVGDVILV